MHRLTAEGFLEVVACDLCSWEGDKNSLTQLLEGEWRTGIGTYCFEYLLLAELVLSGFHVLLKWPLFFNQMILWMRKLRCREGDLLNFWKSLPLIIYVGKEGMFMIFLFILQNLAQFCDLFILQNLAQFCDRKKESEVAQSCPTLCDPMDCSLARLLCLWDSPGKNTGVGCHFLLQF